MENNTHIINLFQKYIGNTIDRAEYEELLRYFGRDINDDDLREYILQMLQAEEIDVDRTALAQTLTHVDRNIRERIMAEKPTIPLFKRIYPYLAAAVVVLIIGFAVYFMLWKQNAQTISSQIADIEPGSHKATLLLEDGQTYELSEDEQEITIDPTGIHYTKGSTIVAQTAATTATLQTPKGGQYRLTLPDGTKVIVNAATTLRYPTQFPDGERRVELTGEAYFQVVPDKNKPFIVQGKEQEITVLGTTFNVSDYVDEPTTTTLFTGQVALSFQDSDLAPTLMPGTQSVLHNGKVSIDRANGEESIAWTRDIFAFNNTPLTEIMKQLERWYDIEVIYPANFQEEHFYAEIPRNRKLSEVLYSLERAGHSTFQQQGRRVTVQQ